MDRVLCFYCVYFMSVFRHIKSPAVASSHITWPLRSKSHVKGTKSTGITINKMIKTYFFMLDPVLFRNWCVVKKYYCHFQW